MNSSLSCLVAALAFATGVSAQTWSFPLNPRAIFLRANNDSPAAPLVLDLASLGVAPGQWLRVGTTGDFSAIGGGQDNFQSLIGVFSASAALLPPSTQHRVVDAIGAGPAFPSPGTWSGGLPMDIAEDFFCSRQMWSSFVEVEVPPGATHLFLGVHDSLCADNTDPDADYGVVVTVLPTPTFAGTSEHIVMKAAVNGSPASSPDVHLAPPGSTITAQLEYPLGFADGSLYLFLADVVPVGGAVPHPLPGLWCEDLIVLKGGVLSGPYGFTDTWSLVVAPGSAGVAVFVQCAALTSNARNGLFETTNAHAFLFQ